MANRVLALVRKLFGWAVERDIVDASPVDGVKRPAKETGRDRVLDDDELLLVWRAADTLGWPFGPVIQLLVLTGQRRGEVAAMKWADLKLEGDEPTWTLPREVTKGDRASIVPLSPQVVAIIGYQYLAVVSFVIQQTNIAANCSFDARIEGVWQKSTL